MKEGEEEIEQLREALTRADRYGELAKLKDKKEVAALEKNEPGNQNLETQFEELIEAVKNTRPSGYKIVDKHIILDRYGRAGTIDWYGYKEEFEDARKYGLLAADSDHVDWSRIKVKVFVNAIKAVQEFLESEEGRHGPGSRTTTSRPILTTSIFGNTISTSDRMWSSWEGRLPRQARSVRAGNLTTYGLRPGPKVKGGQSTRSGRPIFRGGGEQYQ
ncbi:hypothetical protein QA635_32705 [Bradyrhizobium brasilense]|uniref:hypothetical protein n=1 Tax=Bradyrhizobium brasilense TaxID=1419277 RepID=UPI0024B04166|nr:hypothetical protein [Bradyrhizobium australafricanum]WFU31284.1 hypothetical protein QA635_32705 [Bradyrhizobium australafricanum]